MPLEINVEIVVRHYQSQHLRTITRIGMVFRRALKEIMPVLRIIYGCHITDNFRCVTNGRISLCLQIKNSSNIHLRCASFNNNSYIWLTTEVLRSLDTLKRRPDSQSKSRDRRSY